MRIRSVDIEAFRGYNEKVHFNFTMSGGKIASFIALYAPNGFGKTSFFDAIEWSIKSKIERFEEDTVMKISAKREGGNILKNTYSDRKQGSVKIIDESHNFFERLTTSRTEKWDLVKGDVNKESTSIIKEIIDKYDVSNRIEILPQSRIDAFIASKNPSERYDALVNFWGGKDDSIYFKGVRELNKYNEKNIQSIEQEICEIEEYLKYLNENNSVRKFLDTEINNLIKLGIVELKEVKIHDIDSQSKINEFILIVNNLISKVDISIDGYVKHKIVLEKLRNELIEQISYSKIIKGLSDDIIVKKELLSLKQNLIVYNDNFYRNSEIKKDKVKDLSIAKELITLVPLFHDYELKHIECKNEIVLALNEQKDIQIKIDSLNYDRLNDQILFDRAKTNSTRAKDDIHFYNFAKSKFSRLGLEIDLYKSRVILLNKIIEALEDDLNKILLVIDSKEKAILFSIEDHVNNNNLDITLSEKLQDIFRNIRNLIGEKSKLTLTYQENLSLTENLSKLIDLFVSHLHDTKEDNCPLCNASYESYDILINEITERKKKLSNYDNTMSGLESVNKSIDSFYSVANEYFAEYKQNLYKEISINLEESKKREQSILRFNRYLKVYNSRIFNAEEQLSSILVKCGYVKQDEINFDKLIKDANNINNNIVNEITILESRLQQTNKQIQDYSDFQLKANSKLVNLEVKLSTILNDDQIDDIVNKLNYFGVNPDENITNQVESIMLKIETEIVDLNKVESTLKEEINNISNKLNVSDSGFSYDDLLEKEYELENYRKQQEEYKRLYIQNIGEYDLSDSSILSAIEKVDASILFSNDIKVKLFQVRENINTFFLNIEYSEKTTNLIKLKKSLAKYILYKISLDEVQGKLSSFLVKKINSVFNHDLINDIYQKIDPHPQFKSLKLIPSFENDKPELLIKVLNKNGQENIDPLLYLSSAQVNILSLSIFLAKSIQNDNLLLNTILMDDPVQYLDSINILSFIDLMRAIISDKSNDRQIILSTHDVNFFRLLQKKFDPKYYNSKFIEFESYGRLKSQSVY